MQQVSLCCSFGRSEASSSVLPKMKKADRSRSHGQTTQRPHTRAWIGSSRAQTKTRRTDQVGHQFHKAWFKKGRRIATAAAHKTRRLVQMEIVPQLLNKSHVFRVDGTVIPRKASVKETKKRTLSSSSSLSFNRSRPHFSVIVASLCLSWFCWPPLVDFGLFFLSVLNVLSHSTAQHKCLFLGGRFNCLFCVSWPAVIHFHFTSSARLEHVHPLLIQALIMSHLWLAIFHPATSSSQRHWALFIAYPERTSTTEGFLLQTVDGHEIPGPYIFEERLVSNVRLLPCFDKLEYLSPLSNKDVAELRQLAAITTPPDSNKTLMSHFGRLEADGCQNWVYGILKAAAEVSCIEDCAFTLTTLPRY